MNFLFGKTFNPGGIEIVGFDNVGNPITMKNGKLIRKGEVYTGLLYRFDGTSYVPIDPDVSSDDDQPVAESVQQPISPRSDNSDELFYSTQQLPSASPHPRPASPAPAPAPTPAPEPEIDFGDYNRFQGSWIWHRDINEDKGISIDRLNINNNIINGILTIEPKAFSTLYKASWVSSIPKNTVLQLFSIHKKIISGIPYFLQYIHPPENIKSPDDFYKLTTPVIYEFNDTLGNPEHTFPGKSLTGEGGNNPNHFKSTLVNLSEEFSVLTSGKPISIVFRDHDKYTGVDGKGNAKLREPGSKESYNEYLEIFLGNTNWLIREDSTTVGKELLTGAGKRYRKNKSKKRTKKLSKKRKKKLSKKRTMKLSKKRNKKTRKR